MKLRVLLISALCLILTTGQAQTFHSSTRKKTAAMQTAFPIPFDTHPNQSLTYAEAVAVYEKMAAAHPDKLKLLTAGPTDSGFPLHTAILTKDGATDPAQIRASGRQILLINNGIHPGEPEGIDATVMLVRDFLEKPELQAVLEHLAVVIIPVYNIDGALNRGSYSRANQDGPEAYGFRGNARNLDLNRDFAKADSRNARSFNAVFTTWMPDVFVDNHTSNGADYTYTMTLIATQHNKLEAPLGEFLQAKMLPFLYADMKQRGWEMIPYVDGPGETPDSGIFGFCDYGRYSTGYAALFNTIGFMPETHMLKPFADRLKSTRAFMESVIQFIHENHETLAAARAQAFETTRTKETFVLDWAMDTSRFDKLIFKGYAAKYKPSEVSGLPRLWYDRSEPYTKEIPYFNYFKPSETVSRPFAYLIPQAWEQVIQRLEINKVEMSRLSSEVELEVENYFITGYKDRSAYEGHYFHSDVEMEKRRIKRQFFKGDYVIFPDQVTNRYILEMLEPNAPDSYFAWNFFDGALMQKEYFSAYVFEDLAAQFLKENPDVRAQLEAKKASDPKFAGSGKAQLDWVYRQSPWYEASHRRYPVARIESKTDLPLER